ncbi:MAG: hypothetical protein WB421_08625 [Terriglobales bacterium]|jgi:hypothetical protein
MTKSQRFFRYVWRINAVLILLAAGAATVGIVAALVSEFGDKMVRHREETVGVPVAVDGSSADLSLGRAVIVPGSNVVQIDLSLNRGGKGLSSGGYAETRNILFIEPGQKSGRWLLPDNDHVIADSTEINDERDAKGTRTVATAVLVMPASNSAEAGGRLLLFDPTARNIVEAATNVRAIQLAAFSGGELTVLYERKRHLVLAEFDPQSLARKSEQEIDVPQLN